MPEGPAGSQTFWAQDLETVQTVKRFCLSALPINSYRIYKLKLRRFKNDC